MLNFYKWKNKVFFLKNEKYCIICNSTLHSFLPLPRMYTKNWEKAGFPYRADDFETLNKNEFSCPFCGATDRDRFYAVYIEQNILANSAFDGILDIAPSSPLSKWIRKNFSGKYITTDLYMDGVDIRSNIEHMDVFENESFDFLICSHVLEHVNNDLKAMAELWRVLRKGGKAIVMVPIVKNFDSVLENPDITNPIERWKNFGQDDHIRLYSRKIFLERLISCGFRVDMFKASDHKDITRRNGITNGSIIYIATK